MRGAIRSGAGARPRRQGQLMSTQASIQTSTTAGVDPLPAAANLIGRVLIAGLFLHEAWSKLAAYSAAVVYSEAFGVPGVLLPLAIALEVVGGLALLVGFQTRIAALLLAGFC